MKVKRSTKNDNIVAKWRAQFKGTDWINRPSVRIYFDNILLEMNDYERNFCLNFLVAFFTIIRHASDNATVNQHFLHNIKANIQINQMNWHDYLIQFLQNSKSAWTPKKHFTGPLIVLVVRNTFNI
ncbi:hypothetical protein Hanom_Chr07g00594441 [Helianthus anomalus]